MALISKTYSKILAVLLTWLGFSCEHDNGGFICPDYGVPSATYKAKGIVVSQTNDAPIEGIRVVLKQDMYGTEGQFCGIDTVYTDRKGVFNLKSQNYEILSNKLYVEVTDVDGEKNGSFTDMDVVADYSNEKFTGGKGCMYLGEVEKDLGIIKLTPKE